jgi:hypothetical protein
MNQYRQHLQTVFPFLTKDEFLFLRTFLIVLLTNVFKDESMKLSTFSTEGLNATFLCMLFNVLREKSTMTQVTTRHDAIYNLKNTLKKSCPNYIVNKLFSNEFTKNELYDIVKQMMKLFDSDMAVSYFESKNKVTLLNTVKICLSQTEDTEDDDDDYVPSDDETKDDDYVPSDDEDEETEDTEDEDDEENEDDETEDEDEETEDTQDTEDEDEETEDTQDTEDEEEETEDTEDTKDTKMTKVTEDTVSVKNLTRKVNGLCFIMAFAIVWNTCGFTKQDMQSALAHLGFIMLSLMEMGFMMVQNAIIFIWWHILRFDLDTILMSLA